MKKKEEKTRRSFLNLGSGRQSPLNLDSFDDTFLVNVDTIYKYTYNLGYIEECHEKWLEEKKIKRKKFYACSDSFDFLNEYLHKFDIICVYRYMEHVPFTSVLEFIWLLSNVLKLGGYVDVIVPNYIHLANRILNEESLLEHRYSSGDKNLGSLHRFEKENIITTTEVVNVPGDPHASIWTPQRSVYYFEYEGRFKVTDMKEKFLYDGRDIYLRFTAVRI